MRIAAIHQGIGGGNCGFPSVFNIDNLDRALPTIATGEFIQRESICLDLPDVFATLDHSLSVAEAAKPSDLWRQWKQWLFDNARIIPWNPYNSLICVPGIKEVVGCGVLTEAYIDNRELTEFSQAMKDAPIIHFPSNREYRQLGQVATMMAFSNPRLSVGLRRLLKNHVRYAPPIFEIAKKLIEQLPPAGYASLHIRRNDFQFTTSRTSAGETLDNIRNLLADGEPLYIATDEIDENFFDIFGAERSIYRWSDFVTTRCGGLLEHEAIPHELIGPIEQLVCAAARIFIGTELSTFSSYITRIRGYIDALDKNAYFHTTDYDGPVSPEFNRPVHRGRQYLRESPSMWEDV